VGGNVNGAFKTVEPSIEKKRKCGDFFEANVDFSGSDAGEASARSWASSTTA